MEFKQSSGKPRSKAARERWTSFQCASKYSVDGASYPLNFPSFFLHVPRTERDESVAEES